MFWRGDPWGGGGGGGGGEVCGATTRTEPRNVTAPIVIFRIYSKTFFLQTKM